LNEEEEECCLSVWRWLVGPVEALSAYSDTTLLGFVKSPLKRAVWTPLEAILNYSWLENLADLLSAVGFTKGAILMGLTGDSLEVVSSRWAFELRLCSEFLRPNTF